MGITKTIINTVVVVLTVAVLVFGGAVLFVWYDVRSDARAYCEAHNVDDYDMSRCVDWRLRVEADGG